MATCPMPWFPIYASEMLGDEDFISWTPEERGCWITLSARCWADGSIPADIERMAKLCGCNAQAMLKHWESISSKFSKVEGSERYTSNRIEIERQTAIEKAEKLKGRGKAGATARWRNEKTEILKQCLSGACGMLDDATLPLPLPLPLPITTISSATPPCDAPEKKPREKKQKAPRGKNFSIAAMEVSQETWDQIERVWNGWPTKGWNYSTKSEAPRRINKALMAERFNDIIVHSSMRKMDDSRITAKDLADAALSYVAQKVKQARSEGSEISSVCCVANFFSSVENEKNPWKDAVLSYFGG